MGQSKGNPLWLKLGGDDPLFGGWCTLPSSFAAELVANCGVDYAVVDMQHGLSGYQDLVSMMQAISLSGISPMVRIPFGELGTAQRALDAGAMGLIFPMVNAEAFAKQAVQACRYPPLGERSYGPIRARLHLGADTEWVNSQVLCLVQIETKEAMSNLDAILAVPGVDGVYVGPADLALSHGMSPGVATAELDVLLRRIVDACHAHGRIPAIHTLSGVDALDKVALGYRMCSIGSDSVWLQSAYSQQVAFAKEKSLEVTGGLY